MRNIQPVVEKIIKSERQWPRPQRITHAKYRIATAKTADEKVVWLAVLKANTRTTPHAFERS